MSENDESRRSEATLTCTITKKCGRLFLPKEGKTLRTPDYRERTTSSVVKHTVRTSWFLLALLMLHIGQGAAPTGVLADETDDGVAVESLGSTKDSLLLFWEEKDLYVESATRVPKHINQAAENIVVITSREIEEMNAHTLAEVLNTVPGMFTVFAGRDFGSSALVRIQGSEERHATLLMDGVVWNFLASNNADWNQIPVKAIDRIEIIKGPASSVWGSSLGGIVNVITKGTGKRAIPQGSISASFGEARSQDYSAEAFGAVGPAGYYLFAGRQDSQGIRTNGFEKNSLYGKFEFPLTEDLDLFLTSGFSDPEIRFGNMADGSLNLPRTTIRSFFATTGIEYRLNDAWDIKASLHSLNQQYDAVINNITPQMFLMEQIYDEQTIGGNLRLTYTGERNTATAGAEFSHGELQQRVRLAGSVPVETSPNIDRWALFVNDTLAVGNFSITPGIRLDNNSISGAFLSPSLGATWEITDHTIARVSASRGFTTPPLAWMSGGGLGFNGNPGLKEEKEWSYQAGIESGVVHHLSLKGNAFYHDMKGEMKGEVDPAQPTTGHYVNNGHVVRKGYEVAAETAPLHHLSLIGAYAWVRKKADSLPEPVVTYSANVALKYDDRKSLMALVQGSYVRWQSAGSTHNFIWDLNVGKRLFTTKNVTGELFGKVHNIFNGVAYEDPRFPNTRRWLEGGIRLKF